MTTRRGIKDITGKPQLDLVPYDAVVAIARIREHGNDKYHDPSKWYTDVDCREYDNNQRKILEFVAAAMRHCFKYTDAIHYGNRPVDDEESGINHIHHAACSLSLAIALMHKKE